MISIIGIFWLTYIISCYRMINNDINNFGIGKLKKISDEGVKFQSHLNGDTIFLTPELSAQIQQTIGSDIAMLFDECVALPNTEKNLREAVHRSLRWGKRFFEVLHKHWKNTMICCSQPLLKKTFFVAKGVSEVSDQTKRDVCGMKQFTVFRNTGGFGIVSSLCFVPVSEKNRRSLNDKEELPQ